MKTLIIFKGAYRTTFTLSGKRISKKQADLAVFSAKKVTHGGGGWYNLKGFDVLKGEKTRFFLEN